MRATALRTMAVPHERLAVRAARHRFNEELAAVGIDADARDDALLVLSELVSNSVRHAAPLPGGEVLVRWRATDECVHLEITDGGAATRPTAVVATVSALGGRGLDIVRTLSLEWGVTEDAGAVTVWADLPTGASGPGAPDDVIDVRR